MDGLEEENRVLRARVAQLEAALAVGTDPLLRSLAEHAASFLVVVDPEGRFLATGRQSERFGSVIGRQVFDFVAPEYVEPIRAVLARVVATGRAESYESVGYGEDGSPGHTYLTRVVPLTEQGVVAALVMVPTDITERVRLERSLEAQEQALRLAVHARQLWMWTSPSRRRRPRGTCGPTESRPSVGSQQGWRTASTTRSRRSCRTCSSPSTRAGSSSANT